MTKIRSPRKAYTTLVTSPARAVQALLSILGLLLMSVVITAAPASAADGCVREATPAYKHVRATGQKQVYGKGSFYCYGNRVAVTVEVGIAKYNSSDGKWYWVATNLTHTSDGSTKSAMSYGWLCNNYGWGSSGSGYYATYVRGSWMEYGQGPIWTTTWKASDYRYLSC